MKTLILTTIGLLSLSASAEESKTSTNLQATITVTVSTNVVAGDNSSGCNDGHGNHRGSFPATWLPAICAPYKPPTEKWVITNIVRRTVLQIEWKGQFLVHTEDVVVSSKTNLWKLEQDWKLQ